MKRLLLQAVVLLGLCSANPAQVATPEDDESRSLGATIDAYVELQMRKAGIPGLAVGISRGDQIVHLRGYGQADGSGRAVTPDTPFGLGSVSKTFTAFATMQLVETGRVDLDAPVVKYLPWFRTADVSVSRAVTVRHLLNHTSGLPAAAGFRSANEDDRSSEALERYVQRLSTVDLRRSSGGSFEYSNANYIIAALIIETAAGTSYEDYVRRHIFAPLDMRHSATDLATAERFGLAEGYRFWFRFAIPFHTFPFNRAYVPVALQTSSARDMLHYLLAVVNGGRFGDRQVLSPDGVAALQRPAILMPETRDHYGMGWVVREIRGRLPVVSHVGVLPQYRATIIIVPEGKWGVVVLMNASTILMDERLKDLPDGIASLVAGRVPVPRRADRMKLALLFGVPFVALLQLGGVILSVRALSRWRAGFAPRQGAWHAIGLRVILPALVDAALAVALLLFLPDAFGATLPLLILFQPDLGWFLIAMASLAIGWGLTRTVLSFLRFGPLLGWVAGLPGKGIDDPA